MCAPSRAMCARAWTGVPRRTTTRRCPTLAGDVCAFGTWRPKWKAANWGLAIILKKIRLAGVWQSLGIMLKKKIFPHRSRKPPNLCPTDTQRHRSSRETGLALHLCFDMGQTRDFFFNTQINYASSGQQIHPRGGSNSDRQSAKRTTRPTGLAFACSLQ